MVLITFLSFPSSPLKQLKAVPNTVLVVRIMGEQIGSFLLEHTQENGKGSHQNSTQLIYNDESCHLPTRSLAEGR